LGALCGLEDNHRKINNVTNQNATFNIKNKTTLNVKGDVLLAGANLNSGGTVEGNKWLILWHQHSMNQHQLVCQ
jgi:hypothetical protein